MDSAKFGTVFVVTNRISAWNTYKKGGSHWCKGRKYKWPTACIALQEQWQLRCCPSGGIILGFHKSTRLAAGVSQGLTLKKLSDWRVKARASVGGVRDRAIAEGGSTRVRKNTGNIIVRLRATRNSLAGTAIDCSHPASGNDSPGTSQVQHHDEAAMSDGGLAVNSTSASSSYVNSQRCATRQLNGEQHNCHRVCCCVTHDRDLFPCPFSPLLGNP